MGLSSLLRRLFQPDPTRVRSDVNAAQAREAEQQQVAQERQESHEKRHNFLSKVNAVANLTDLANRNLDAALVKLRLIQATARDRDTHDVDVGTHRADGPEPLADDTHPH